MIQARQERFHEPRKVWNIKCYFRKALSIRLFFIIWMLCSTYQAHHVDNFCQPQEHVLVLRNSTLVCPLSWKKVHIQVLCKWYLIINVLVISGNTEVMFIECFSVNITGTSTESTQSISLQNISSTTTPSANCSVWQSLRHINISSGVYKGNPLDRGDSDKDGDTASDSSRYTVFNCKSISILQAKRF